MVTTIRACLASGFVSARRNARLAVLLWVVGLLLALPAWLPFSAWFSGALSFTRGADTLLTSLDLGVLREMVQYDDTNVWRLMAASLFGAAAVAAFVGALLAGGTVDLVMAERAARVTGAPRDPRRFLHRFFRAGGHFFWRNLTLLALHAVGGIGIVALAFAAVSRAVRPLGESLSVAVSWLNLAAAPIVAGVLLVFFWLVLDVARILLVQDDQRNAAAIWWRALRVTLRRAGTAYALWLGITVTSAVVAWLLFLAHGVLVGAGGRPVVLLVVLLQLAALARAWFRVALIGGEVEFVIASVAPVGSRQSTVAVAVPGAVAVDSPVDSPIAAPVDSRQSTVAVPGAVTVDSPVASPVVAPVDSRQSTVAVAVPGAVAADSPVHGPIDSPVGSSLAIPGGSSPATPVAGPSDGSSKGDS